MGGKKKKHILEILMFDSISIVKLPATLYNQPLCPEIGRQFEQHAQFLTYLLLYMAICAQTTYCMLTGQLIAYMLMVLCHNKG